MNLTWYGGSQFDRDTRALALPRGRRVGQPGHDTAKTYLIRRMEDLGLPVFCGDSYELGFVARHPVTDLPQEFANLVARIPGRNPELDPVLVGAHYDSVIDAPCADDNATAVAVTLAVAGHFQQTRPERDLIVALFDSEEPPFFHSPAMGSTRFYKDHCAGKMKFACAIIMDLIGHDVDLPGLAPLALVPGIRNLLFVLGAESHHALQAVVENAASRIGKLRILPTLNDYIGDLSDHHAFRLGGEPFLFLSCGWGRYYHHPKDDMEWINLDKVRRVYDFVVCLVEELGGAKLTSAEAQSDSAEFEIRMMQKALGVKLTLLQKLWDLLPLKTRSDLDNFVAMTIGGTIYRG